jgi:hypothetical protein
MRQVGFTILMGKMKNAPAEGALVCNCTLLLNNFLDIFLLRYYFWKKSWPRGAAKIAMELKLQ